MTIIWYRLNVNFLLRKYWFKSFYFSTILVYFYFCICVVMLRGSAIWTDNILQGEIETTFGVIVKKFVLDIKQ